MHTDYFVWLIWKINKNPSCSSGYFGKTCRYFKSRITRGITKRITNLIFLSIYNPRRHALICWGVFWGFFSFLFHLLFSLSLTLIIGIFYNLNYTSLSLHLITTHLYFHYLYPNYRYLLQSSFYFAITSFCYNILWYVLGNYYNENK